MKLGLLNYFNHIEHPHCLLDKQQYRLIKEAGFDAVMLFGDSTISQQVSLCKEAGLEVAFVHHPYVPEDKLWEEGAEGDAMAKDTMDNLSLYAKLKIPIVVFHPCYKAVYTPVGMARLKKICARASEAGILIALENMRMGTHLFERILQEIQDPHVGVCYDAGHHNLLVSKNDFITPLKHRIFAVHLHDNFGASDAASSSHQDDRHMIPFTGKVDWDYVTSVIASSPYQGPVLLELHKEFHDSTVLLDTKSYLKKAAQAGKKLKQMIEEKQA